MEVSAQAREIHERAIVIELAHISDTSFRDTIDYVDGPFILTHTGLLQVDSRCRAAFDHVVPVYGMTRAQEIDEETIHKVLGGNYLRIFDAVW